MPGQLILIVEDDAGAAETFVPILRSHGYDVRVAVDAETGFDEIERGIPAMVLVDLHLPVLSGVDFVRQVRQRLSDVEMPVAMMTGDYLVDDSVTSELRALGTPLYFKPLWAEDLLAIVGRHIGDATEISLDCGKVPTRRGSR
jgi:DNA-binding response OmpR family regulator